MTCSTVDSKLPPFPASTTTYPALLLAAVLSALLTMAAATAVVQPALDAAIAAERIGQVPIDAADLAAACMTPGQSGVQPGRDDECAGSLRPDASIRRQQAPRPAEPAFSSHSALRRRWNRASVPAFAGTYGDYLLAKVGKVLPQLKEAVL